MSNTNGLLDIKEPTSNSGLVTRIFAGLAASPLFGGNHLCRVAGEVGKSQLELLSHAPLV
jgi:hypothetical protein